MAGPGDVPTGNRPALQRPDVVQGSGRSSSRAAQHIGRELQRRRDGVQFQQLFSYRYADGAQMLTIGGVIDQPSALANLQTNGVLDWPFSQPDPNGAPMEINVPWLTAREKAWLDQHIADGIPAPKLDFDLEQDALLAFRRYYREYPAYFETLI